MKKVFFLSFSFSLSLLLDILFLKEKMSVVSSNKIKPGRPSSSLSSNTAAQSTVDSEMLSVSSRQRQSKKDEVKK
jgi:uncharacterized membrane protein (UPF0127 family)